MNSSSEDDLNTIKIKGMILDITWARKVVGKHQHLDTVHAKIDIMQHQVKMFIELFTHVFKKGFPFIWEESGKMFSQEE